MFKRLSLALLGLSLATPLMAQKQAKRFFNNTDGLVDRYSKTAAPQTSASDIQNIMLDDRGQLSKRTAQVSNNTVIFSTITGIGYFGGSAGFFALTTGTTIYRTGNTLNGTYTAVTGTVTITASGTNLTQFTPYNNSLIGCNDSDYPFKVQSTGNAFTLVGVSTIAHTCAGFGNYLILGNTKEGSTLYPNRIRWSDVNNADSWPANNYIDVEPDDSDGIISLAQFEDSVYIFKKRSIHRLIITGLAGSEAFITRPVARGIGAWAKNAVQIIDNTGVVFLSQNGVYLFDGQTLQLISDNVQRQIDSITRTRYMYSVGAVYRNRNQYWLAYSNGTQNNEVLVYDYIQRSWTVYTDINANAMGVGEDSNGNAVLLTGSNVGYVHKQDVTSDNDTVDGTSAAINSYYVTQDLHFDVPEIEKTFRYLYVFTTVDSTTTVTLNTAYNFDNVYISSFSFTLGEEGALWDTAIWDTDIWPATVNRVFRVTLNRTGRLLRIKFSNSSLNEILGILGWVVVYEYQDWREP